jgi:hypothetical protein
VGYSSRVICDLHHKLRLATDAWQEMQHGDATRAPASGSGLQCPACGCIAIVLNRHTSSRLDCFVMMSVMADVWPGAGKSQVTGKLRPGCMGQAGVFAGHGASNVQGPKKAVTAAPLANGAMGTWWTCRVVAETGTHGGCNDISPSKPYSSRVPWVLRTCKVGTLACSVLLRGC